MKIYASCLAVIVLLATLSCKEATPETETKNYSKKVLLETNFGDIRLALYDDTPLHRDNFIKLVEEAKYDSLLFHRVINNFMIQAGDPESKDAGEITLLGNGDLPYIIPAEITDTHFHKRGALGAARNGNHARASSAMQFYITQGRVHTDSMLTVAQGRINKWLAEHKVVNDPKNNAWATILDQVARDERLISQDSLQLLRSRVDSLANLELQVMVRYSIPKAHREMYKTDGGTPHLDQNYTVFGEVLSGMNVVDSIAATPTNTSDRPLTNVRILSARVEEQ